MKIVLSYADSDSVLARALADRLAGAGLRVWFDAREIVPGDNWGAEVQRGLEDADALVVLLSPAAMRSRWVQRDIQYALGTPRFAGRLVPVQVRRTPSVPWMKAVHVIRAGRNLDDVARRIVNALEPSEN